MISNTPSFAAKIVLVCATCALGETRYVDTDAQGKNDGTTWQDARTSLERALQEATPGDDIWVAEGTYGPISLKSGVRIYGGFSGSERSLSDADSVLHRTIISGGGSLRAVESISNDATTVLEGFFITEGFVDFPNVGAGLLVKDSDALFVRCVFMRNHSIVFGGALGIKSGSPTFVNCKFLDNDGGWGAGAVYVRRTDTANFVNCLFVGNKALEAGAVAIVEGTVVFTNCTVAGNQATLGRGSAFFDSIGTAVLRNCIVWGNTSAIPGDGSISKMKLAPNYTSVDFSVIEGGFQGNSNLDTDPLFVNAATGDYRLQAGSPCRDRGNNAALPDDSADLSGNGNRTETLPRDLDLRSRVEGTTVDMGAFERPSDGS